MQTPTAPNSTPGPPRCRTLIPVQAGHVGATANRLAAAPPAGDIVLDLAGVHFVGSEELDALVVLNQKVRAAGGRVRLVNVGPPVGGVLAVTRLDTLLDVRRAEVSAA
jgi:anti-anti-sigma factor